MRKLQRFLAEQFGILEMICCHGEPHNTAIGEWEAIPRDALEMIPHYSDRHNPVFAEWLSGEILEICRRRCMEFGHFDGSAEETQVSPRMALAAVGRLLAWSRSQQKQPGGLLTVQQAADRLNVSIRTIYDLCDSGRLACQRIGAGRGTIRIRPEDLSGYLAKPAPKVYEHLSV